MNRSGVHRPTGPAHVRRFAACCALIVAAAADGCASQGMPPGGPPDKVPPQLVKVTPESGAVKVTPGVVDFRFDEVVSERPRGAPSLEQLVLISPSDGPPSVTWGRDRLVIRPSRGWRPNTAYTVSVLPGLSDLRGNSADNRFTTVFSTGAEIPGGVLRGVAFDWMAGKSVPGARVEATAGGDTVLKWVTAADSTGRFALGSLPARQFTVRAWVDQNNNGVRDTRESWDSASVALTDSARFDLYMFPHDSLGARMGEVTIADSITIRVRFDHGLSPVNPISVAQLRLVRTRDSTELRILSILPAAQHDSVAGKLKASRDDSIARADTSVAGRRAVAKADSTKAVQVRDSTARAQTASIRAARDTVKRVPPPLPARPVPPTEFVIVTAVPLPEEVELRLYASDVRALVGPPRSTDRRIMRRKPPPVRDSTATKRPPGAGHR